VSWTKEIARRLKRAKNCCYYATNSKYKRNFDLICLIKKIITRNKNGTKIVVIIQFTKNPKEISIISYLRTTYIIRKKHCKKCCFYAIHSKLERKIK
jgi:hypothetical protein